MLSSLRTSAPVSAAKSMIWLLRFLTLVFCLGPGSTVTQKDSNPLMVNGVLGESVTLPRKFPAEEKINSIFWLHNGRVIATIDQIETESPKNKLYDLKRKEQLTYNQFFLRISNLTMEDMGIYSAQIISNTSNTLSDYSLRIFRRLRNLTITTISVSPENKTCEIHLICSVESPNDDVSFTWQPLGKTGPNLTISWDSRNSSEHNSYTCIAKNPVSDVSSSVSTNGLCKDDTKNMPLNVKLVWIVIAVISIVTFGCMLGWLHIWRKNTDVFQFSASQNQSPETARNIEYTPVAPGKTVYAQVNLSHTKMESKRPMKNNDPSTIYSTVQQTKEKPLPYGTTAFDNTS